MGADLPEKPLQGPVHERPAPAGAPTGQQVQDTPVGTAPTWDSGVAVQGDPATGVAEAAKAGDPVTVVALSVPGKSWSELTSANPMWAKAVKTNSDPVWAIPLTMQGASLADIAAGKYDTQWSGLGDVIAQHKTPGVVRLVTPSTGSAEEGKAAFTRAAESIKKASPKTRIEWDPPLGLSAAELDAAYPGDGVVDLVGVSVVDSSKSWLSVLNGPGGLTERSDWAAKQGKPMAIHWAIAEKSPSSWVVNMRDWIEVSAVRKRVAMDTVTTANTGQAVAEYRRLW